MNNTIDIEALSKMPITKEFAELLFDYKSIDLDRVFSEIEDGEYHIWHLYMDYFFNSNGTITYCYASAPDPLSNAFSDSTLY